MRVLLPSPDISAPFVHQSHHSLRLLILATSFVYADRPQNTYPHLYPLLVRCDSEFRMIQRVVLLPET